VRLPRFVSAVAAAIIAVAIFAAVAVAQHPTDPVRPSWVQCNENDTCTIDESELPPEIPAVNERGEIIGSVDPALVYMPPPGDTGAAGGTVDEDDTAVAVPVTSANDEVVGQIDQTGFTESVDEKTP
jgi:hypothetical protein